MTRKVMRPKAWDPKKVKFPVWLQPKIDGVRAYNPEGTLLARTQKLHRNKHTTGYFSKPEFIGLDGELAAQLETHADLCRITSSAVGTIEGEPYVAWWLFDYVTPQNCHLPYSRRYEQLCAKVEYLKMVGSGTRLRVVPYVVCNNLQELEEAHQRNMEAGYEGSCIYNPDLPHKEGDSSASHGGVNRIKDFVDFEVEILEIEEGQENLNEAQINELGRTYRTSHQANKVGNGMVGSLKGRVLKDVFDLYDKKKLLLAKDQIVTISPGNMGHESRRYYFQNPQFLINAFAKCKFFPKGIKDLPRFPTFYCLRSSEDL